MILPKAFSPIYTNTSLLYYRINSPIGIDVNVKFRQLDCRGAAKKLENETDPEQARIIKTLTRELDSGSTVYIYEDDSGRIAHYSCVGYEKIWKSEMDMYLNLPDGARYIYNCRTLPEYSRRGLFTSAIESIINTHGEAFISCADTNRNSKSVIEKFSPTSLGKIHKRQILGFYKRYTNTTGLEFSVD